MNQIFERWVDCRNDRLKIDKSEFLGLFKSGLSDSELREALAGFRGSDVVFERIRKVLDVGSLAEQVYLQNPSISDAESTAVAARAWLDELARFCSDGGASNGYA